jgi:hypothetical protein
MRHLFKFLLFLFFAMTLNSCEKDDENSSQTDPDRAERFSCNINGEPFYTSGNFNCSSLLFSYTTHNFKGEESHYVVFRGVHCPSGNAVGVRLHGMKPTTGFIDMTNPTYADSCSPYIRLWYGSETDIFEELISGSLNITEMYPRNIDNTDEFGRFRGTFEFTVRSETSGDTLKVTDGSFNYRVGSFW